MAKYRNGVKENGWPLDAAAGVAKALGDPGRLRILCAVGDRELCVCRLVELLGLAPSTVSKHLSVLKAARLIETRRDGRWIHCRAANASAPAPARSALRWALDLARHIPEIRADRTRLDEVRKIDTEAQCRPRARR